MRPINVERMATALAKFRGDKQKTKKHKPSHSVVDLTGETFGRWKVIRMTGRRMIDGQPIGTSEWICRCECGRVKERVGYAALIQGHSKSCGCLRREIHSRPPEAPIPLYVQKRDVYAIWLGMKTRCYNEKHPSYQRYGKRGITIYDKWKNDFDAFYFDMGERPRGMSIERKDNNGPYSPENCYWATRVEQARNTRRNVRLEWKGEMKLLIEIAIAANVNYNSFRNKVMDDSMTVEEAVTYCQERGLVYHERAKSRGGSKKPVRAGWERKKKQVLATGHRGT